jgi:uncharacterized membrane protein YuzA (DUF378 family)
LYDDYVRALANPPVDGARVVAETEKRFFDLSDRARFRRHILGPIGWGLVGLAAADFAVEQFADKNPTARLQAGVVDGCVGFAGLATAIISSVPSPIERLGDLWANDPAIQRLPRTIESPHISIAPLRGGGAAIGLTGAF